MLLNRQLRSRRQRLMTMRRESNERLADFAVADVSLFWLLNALNSHATVLQNTNVFLHVHLNKYGLSSLVWQAVC
jgi:predicted component of type VI protein secretion system